MKGIIVAIVSSAICTAGVCFFAFKVSPVGGATIDGSTEETFKSSIEKVRQALPQESQERFEQAMTTIAGAVMLPPEGGNPIAALLSLSADPGAASRKIRTRIHGMTASDVIAASITAAADSKERAMQIGGLPSIDASGFKHSRMLANESAAIATLKNISSAQAQCQASGVIDTNGNQTGEYGFMAELAGIAPVRGSTGHITPPVLSSAFGMVDNSLVKRSGYVFQMLLPDQNALGLAEAPTGGSGIAPVDSGQAEVLWCCYAWPSDCGESGTRAFFINQSGDVLASSNTSTCYSGPHNGPTFLAAYAIGSTTMAAAVAANVTGNDGETWILVN